MQLRGGAFVWDEGRTVELLGDRVAELPIGNRPLAAHQEEALGPPAPARIARLDEIPAGAADYLLVGGHVYLTRRLARRFRAAARRAGATTAVLALEPCVFTRSTTALAGVRRDGERVIYDVWYRAAAGPPTETELLAATPIALAIAERPMPNDVLERRGLRPDGMEVALTAEAVLHLRHWSHLVVANYVALYAYWFDFTPAKVMRYLGAIVRAGWPSWHRLMRALTVRGRRVNVHPSAVVEASVLGDGVEIGPCAVVRGSMLGDRVKVDAHANVNFSSVGEAAVVSFNAVCNLSVLYPQAMLSLYGAQMAVLGRRATVLSTALLMDLRDPYLEEEVLVEDGGRRVASGRKVLGPCVGHEAVIGARVQLAPGLAVPNGAYLVGDPNAIIRRLGPLEPRLAHAAEGGGVAPIKKR